MREAWMDETVPKKEYRLSLAETAALQYVAGEREQVEKRLVALASEIETAHGMTEGAITRGVARVDLENGTVTEPEIMEGGNGRGNVDSE